VLSKFCVPEGPREESEESEESEETGCSQKWVISSAEALAGSWRVCVWI
jgi:hypothetical protein